MVVITVLATGGFAIVTIIDVITLHMGQAPLVDKSLQLILNEHTHTHTLTLFLVQISKSGVLSLVA